MHENIKGGLFLLGGLGAVAGAMTMNDSRRENEAVQSKHENELTQAVKQRKSIDRDRFIITTPGMNASFDKDTPSLTEIFQKEVPDRVVVNLVRGKDFFKKEQNPFGALDDSAVFVTMKKTATRD